MSRATIALIALVLTLAAAAPASAQSSKRGALVRLPYAYEGTLTPYTFKNAYGLVTLVYDTLLWRDAAGVPRPWLARAVHTSADGRRISVRLARDARWQDGPPVTAADVAFTFERLRADPHPRFTPELRALERVSVTGPDRLVIHLRQPSPGFLDQPLADVPILPRHLWAGLPPGRVPPGPAVGSGPYRLVAAGPAGYRFVANRRWFRGTPAVREIRTVPLTNPGAVSRALDDGRIDLAAVRATAGSPAGLEAPGLALERGPSYLGTVLMFNLRRAPFHGARVRRAIAQALDLPRIARAAAGPDDTIEPAEHGLLHPRSPWASRADLHEFDPAAARPVLARLARPLRVLAARDDAEQLAAGRAVVAALRRAGARAALVARSSRRLAAAVGRDRRSARPDFDLAIWSSAPLASHDPDYLRTMFGRGGPLNYSGYDSEAFERAADRVAGARPARARRAAVAGELSLLAHDVPVVPLFFGQAQFVSRRAAWDGWRFVAGDGVIDKRSFVSAPSPRRRTAPASAPVTDSTGIGALGFLAFGLLVLAGSIVLVGSLRGRARAR